MEKYIDEYAEEFDRGINNPAKAQGQIHAHLNVLFGYMYDDYIGHINSIKQHFVDADAWREYANDYWETLTGLKTQADMVSLGERIMDKMGIPDTHRITFFMLYTRYARKHMRCPTLRRLTTCI